MVLSHICKLKKRRGFCVGFSGDNRVQVPRLVRWRHKLEPGEILYVKVENRRSYGTQTFYVTLSKDGRFTIPDVVMEALEAEADKQPSRSNAVPASG